MKIGFVFDDSLDNNDGIQQYMFSLTDWFIAQGHEVHYLVGETKRTDIVYVHSLARNIKVNFNGNHLSIPLWGNKRRIRQLLTKEQFDVLHVQVPYHPLLAGRIIAAAAPTTRVIGTFHIAPYSRLASFATRLLGIWSRPTLRRFDAMVSVSPAAQQLAQQAFHYQTTVVPNAFDYQRFAAGRRLDQFTSDVPTIVFLGRLVPRKGCQVLLQAIVTLRQSYKGSLKVIICGDGQLRPTLEAFVRENALQDIVQFEGRISEQAKPDYLATADIAVFPSSAGESFGIVLIEAMASGRAAVLGGNNPGYRSVLGQRPDLLFNPRDSDLLAQKLYERLTNQALRQADAIWGAEHSRQFDVAVVGQKLLDIYQPVASNSSNES